MMTKYLDYAYIASTIIFTVYGQLALKWRVRDFGAFPADAGDKLRFLASLLVDPVIISGFAAAFLASLAWIAVMTKFELSHAYPFMSLNFVIVLVLSAWVFGEPLTTAKSVGVLLIVAGTVVAARG